jgi:hypothetical protein
MSEKRVLEGIIRVSTENGWWLQIPNYDDCGRELDEAAGALEDKPVRITIEPLPVAPQPASQAPEIDCTIGLDPYTCGKNGPILAARGHCSTMCPFVVDSEFPLIEKLRNASAPGPSTDG